MLKTLITAMSLALACGTCAAANGPVTHDTAVPATVRQPNGDGSVRVSGELMQWHKVTVDLAGPFAHEADQTPNPFVDLNYTVTFAHESGAPVYKIPGYFAADGKAADTSAESGTVWRAHLSPDKPGTWSYTIGFTQGPRAAIGGAARPLAPFDGKSGTFVVAATDKSGADFRAKGRLQYVGKHHLKFAGTGEWFLKAGPDAPETLLGYSDFDNTIQGKKTVPLKTWGPHTKDWRVGDPTWKGGKGKGLIGALNYLSSKGVNSVSFLTYNAGGDGDNVWPFASRNAKLSYDCSKLDQWGVVFDHGTRRGLHLHFKLQETENDDHRLEPQRKAQVVPEALDAGKTDVERKVYLRELVARFGHALALNWNLGEENTQTPEEQRAMAQWLVEIDPYHHHLVIHSYPTEQERVYVPLLGKQSSLTGASLQNDREAVHRRTLQWIEASDKAGKPWVVANDEQGPHYHGVPPDPAYLDPATQKTFDGVADDKPKNRTVDLHKIRKYTLWGNLMAGGAGVEYYFGYELPQTDLNAEDWRSRDKSWDYCRIALEFFRNEKIPFWDMKNVDALVGNPQRDNSKYCFAKFGDLYLVFLPNGGTTSLDLGSASGTFAVSWFNPRTGGNPQIGSVPSVSGGAKVDLGRAPADASQDWLVIVRRQ